MASKRQIEANQENAKRSTGPKSLAGRAKSSRNAYRHGLSRAAAATSLEPGAIAAAIASKTLRPSGPISGEELIQIRLRLARIRAARLDLLKLYVDGPDGKQARVLSGIERYDKAARAGLRRVLKRLRHESRDVKAMGPRDDERDPVSDSGSG